MIPISRESTMPIVRRLPISLALLAALGGCARPALQSAMPDGIELLSRSEWGARAPVLPMRLHTIRRLTIHHTAVRQAPTRSTAEKLRGLQQFSQREDTLGNGRPKRAWADVPYHLYVASDGSVAEGREWRFVGDSNTPYDPTGHLQLVVEGNFEEEPLTEAQRRTLERLVPALVRRFRIPPETIAGHGDHVETLCPGKALAAELPRLRELAGAAR